MSLVYVHLQNGFSHNNPEFVSYNLADIQVQLSRHSVLFSHHLSKNWRGVEVKHQNISSSVKFKQFLERTIDLLVSCFRPIQIFLSYLDFFISQGSMRLSVECFYRPSITWERRPWILSNIPERLTGQSKESVATLNVIILLWIFNEIFLSSSGIEQCHQTNHIRWYVHEVDANDTRKYTLCWVLDDQLARRLFTYTHAKKVGVITHTLS